MSKQLQVNTREERRLWFEMKKILAKHDSYHSKKQYYPFKMDLWENERKQIEKTYRDKIQEENKKSIIVNMERENMRREEFVQREIEKKNLREKRAEYRKQLKEEQIKNPPVLRRSKRIQKKQEQ